MELYQPAIYSVVIAVLFLLSVYLDAWTTYTAVRKGYVELNPLIEEQPQSGLIKRWLFILPVVLIAAYFEYIQVLKYQPEITRMLTVKYQHFLPMLVSMGITLVASVTCVKFTAAFGNAIVILSGRGLPDIADYFYRGSSRIIRFILVSLLYSVFWIPLFYWYRSSLLNSIS